MRMKKQFARCFAEYSDGVWVAYCLDFGLGAQAASYKEAKAKLEAQLRDLSAAEARAALRRGSPAWLWARYWFVWTVVRVARAFGRAPHDRKRFKESIPRDFALC